MVTRRGFLGFLPATMMARDLVPNGPALEMVRGDEQVLPAGSKVVMNVQFDEAQMREITKQVTDNIMRSMRQGRIYLER